MGLTGDSNATLPEVHLLQYFDKLNSKPAIIMTFITSWDDFYKAAEKLYLEDPLKCRFVIKYRHNDGQLCVKVTDDAVCLQYRTEHAQDIKKLEKLTSQLMRHMASKDGK